jgi:hypothetical protein
VSAASASPVGHQVNRASLSRAALSGATGGRHWPCLGWRLEQHDHMTRSAARAAQPGFKPGEGEGASTGPDQGGHVQFGSKGAIAGAGTVVDLAVGAAGSDAPSPLERLSNGLHGHIEQSENKRRSRQGGGMSWSPASNDPNIPWIWSASHQGQMDLPPTTTAHAVPDHSTFSVNRHGRFRDSDLLRQVFEAVVRACMDAGLIKGEGFAIDASVMEADASRYHGKAPILVTARDGPSKAIITNRARPQR